MLDITNRFQKGNKFISMDYNQFTYYRANPFAKQGFIPTVALNNRTKASFPS